MMKNASNVNFFAKIFAQSAQKTYLCHAKAQMAELVDALVSNTSGFTSMPVRSRLWVLKRGKLKNFPRFLFPHSVTYWGLLVKIVDKIGAVTLGHHFAKENWSFRKIRDSAFILPFVNRYSTLIQCDSMKKY